MRAWWICGAVAVAASCARPPEPTGPAEGQALRLSLVSSEITSLDFEEARGELRFRVRNPRPEPVQLERIEWRMNVADVDSVEGRTYLGAVPSGFDGEMIARIRLPYDQLSVALGAHPNRSFLSYTVSGEGIFIVPDRQIRRSFQGDGTMPVLHRPTLSLDEIRVRSAPSGAQLVAADLVVSTDDGQIRSLRSAGMRMYIQGREVARVPQGQVWTDLGRIVVPVQIDLQGLSPGVSQSLRSGEGTVQTTLELRAIADTVHGEVPVVLRGEQRSRVVGAPAL